jgi:hypothetical protein
MAQKFPYTEVFKSNTELHEAIQRAAELDGRTVSGLLRKITQDYCAQLGLYRSDMSLVSQSINQSTQRLPRTIHSYQSDMNRGASINTKPTELIDDID